MSLARCTGYFYECSNIIDTDAEPESCEHDDRILCAGCREALEHEIDERNRKKRE